jgi:hypothetical protein
VSVYWRTERPLFPTRYRALWTARLQPATSPNRLHQTSGHKSIRRLRVQSTRSRVLDTTYFFTASILRAKGSIQSGLAPVAARRAKRRLHHFVSHPPEAEGVGLHRGSRRVTMQHFFRQHCTMIAAPVQCDNNGIPERSHYARVPPIWKTSKVRPRENRELRTLSQSTIFYLGWLKTAR